MSQASAASAMTAADASTCSERDHRGTLREASCPPGKLHQAGSPTRQAAGRPSRTPSSNRTGEAVVRMRRVSHHHMYMCHIIIICICVTSSYVECGGGRRQGCSGRVCRVCRLSDGIVAGCLRPNAPITGQVVPRCLQAHTLYTLSVHTLSAHTLSLRAHSLCAGINHIRHPANACHVFIGYVFIGYIIICHTYVSHKACSKCLPGV